MRWPSPTRDPIADLACFCDDCRRAATSAGVHLGAVAERVRRGSVDAAARADLLRELLGIDEREPLASFMAWRTGRVTEMVVAAADLVTRHTASGGARLRLGLDVYAPSLARLVGQDISGLAPLGELTKAMLYVGTHGPAGLPYELCRLASWLAAAGMPDPVSRLSDWLGYALPPLERLCSGTLEPDVFAVELERLQQLAGPTAAAGIDAVELAGVGVLDDVTLGRVARVASSSGVAIVLSWDLWAIPPRRLEAVARSIAGARPSGGAA
jgi:hypothetical protein